MQKQHKDASIGYLLEGEVRNNQNKPADAANAYAEAFKAIKRPQSLMRLHSARTAAGQIPGGRQGGGRSARANRRIHYASASQPGEPKRSDPAGRQMLEYQKPRSQPVGPSATRAPMAEQAIGAEQLNVPVDTLGTLLMDKGNTAKGVETLKEAVGLGVPSRQLRINFARALIKAGDKDARKGTRRGPEGRARSSRRWPPRSLGVRGTRLTAQVFPD